MSAVDPSVLPAFAVASTVVVLAPGADVFLLLRTSMRHGARSGLSALVGIHVGNLIQAALMVSGVGLVLSRSDDAMTALQWIGATYLLYLAFTIARSLLAGEVPPAPLEGAEEPTDPAGATRSHFTTGLLTNLTNPKVVLFFLAFFPQFIGDAERQALQLTLLSATFIAIAFVWELALVIGAAKVAPWVTSRRGITILDAVTAVAFTLIGVALVVAG